MPVVIGWVFEIFSSTWSFCGPSVLWLVHLLWADIVSTHRKPTWPLPVPYHRFPNSFQMETSSWTSMRLSGIFLMVVPTLEYLQMQSWMHLSQLTISRYLLVMPKLVHLSSCLLWLWIPWAVPFSSPIWCFHKGGRAVSIFLRSSWWIIGRSCRIPEMLGVVVLFLVPAIPWQLQFWQGPFLPFHFEW